MKQSTKTLCVRGHYICQEDMKLGVVCGWEKRLSESPAERGAVVGEAFLK